MTTPVTPAEIARAALDGISAHQASLNMQWWYTPGPDNTNTLAPDEGPGCGTTMCAAGWVAHAAGWTLVHSPKAMRITTMDGGTELVTAYAEKDGRFYPVWDVATYVLRVDPAECPWWDSKEEALDFLRAIADGHA